MLILAPSFKNKMLRVMLLLPARNLDFAKRGVGLNLQIKFVCILTDEGVEGEPQSKAIFVIFWKR